MKKLHTEVNVREKS